MSEKFIIDTIDKKSQQLNITNEINYILEIGTNKGYKAVELAQRFPNAQIIGVEANPFLIEEINQNTRNFSNIKVFNFGASDENNELNFYISKTSNTGTSSFLEKTGGYDHVENLQFHVPIKVKTKRLDEFLNEINIPKIDILWMDIQGFEGKALNGLGNFLNNIKIIYSEITYKSIYKDQILFDKFDYKLLQHNFSCIYRDYKCNDFWGDAIYMNNILRNREQTL
jgi:FkbM family methyltransferase